MIKYALAVIILLLLGSGAWACEPRKWVDASPHMPPIGLTTGPTSSTTLTSAHSSGTSGCGRESDFARITPETFIADMYMRVDIDASRGGGAHLRSLATLLGCQEAAFPSFAGHLQANHAQLFTSKRPSPAQWMIRLRQSIGDNAALARDCPAHV